MYSMNLIGKFLTNFRDFYKDINAATLTGAIDVVVVEQPDGSFTCSPFHVRFGKLGVLRSREKIVDIEVNGEPLDIHMKLGESGEAFFVEEVSPGEDGDEESIPSHLACSPIPSHDHLNQWMQQEDEKEKELERQKALVFTPEAVTDHQNSSYPQTDFRPIGESFTGDRNMEIGNQSSSSASLSHSNSKRKRRKKSSTKRRLSQIQKTPSESQPVEASVFAMDDVDPKPAVNDSEAKTETENFGALKQNDSFSDLKLLPLTTDTDFHFFSDTELTMGCSPESRSPSPIASDTELEQRRHAEEVADAGAPPQSWKWGELPSPPLRHSVPSDKVPVTAEEEEAVKKKEQEEEHRSMLSGMFSFMKKTKHLRHGQADGVYLSELNADDPEVAALYFPHHYRTNPAHDDREIGAEDDAESGNGPSVPHSPSSQSPPITDWASYHKGESLDVSMSLCGQLDVGVSHQLFNHYLVSYDDLVANPMLIEHPDLVVKVGSKYYNWRMACPLVMCMALFKRPLPEPVVEILSNQLMPAKLKELKEQAKPSGYYSWFTWRRTTDPAVNGAQLPIEKKLDDSSQTVQQDVIQESEKIDTPEKEEGYAGSNSSEESDTGPSQQQAKLPMERRFYQQSDKCRKTLRLTSQQIASLNLNHGANEVEFSVTTAYQGTTRCKCHIYKWRHDDKIVISDIDGTITKSDVLGHVLPIVGKDWAQSGVAQLFTKIKNNGYKLLYLSARAIGQARVTREYLRSIKQGDLSLPDGPLLLNPTSLISAFHREVIEKKPEEFKISCLRDIAALFPVDSKPFYAGYGNRVNDVWAYKAVGIPIVRIFTINHRGELKHDLSQTFQSSYNNMCQLVDEMFPPPLDEALAEDYSQFIYWRDPLPYLDFKPNSD